MLSDLGVVFSLFGKLIQQTMSCKFHTIQKARINKQQIYFSISHTHGSSDIYHIIWSHCLLTCEGGINLMMLAHSPNKHKSSWSNIEIKYHWIPVWLIGYMLQIFYTPMFLLTEQWRIQDLLKGERVKCRPEVWRHDGFECIQTLVWAIQAISVFLSTTHVILTQFRLEYCFRS